MGVAEAEEAAFVGERGRLRLCRMLVEPKGGNFIHVPQYPGSTDRGSWNACGSYANLGLGKG